MSRKSGEFGSNVNNRDHTTIATAAAAATSSASKTKKKPSGATTTVRVKSTEEVKSIVAAYVVTALKPYLKNGTIASSSAFKALARELTSSVVSAGSNRATSGSSNGSTTSGSTNMHRRRRVQSSSRAPGGGVNISDSGPALPPLPTTGAFAISSSAPVSEHMESHNTTEDSPLFGMDDWDIAPATKAVTKSEARTKAKAKASPQALASSGIGNAAGFISGGGNGVVANSTVRTVGDTRSSRELEAAAFSAVRIKICDLNPLVNG
jgi:hypothetical protein